jgi:hypothetical protein
LAITAFSFLASEVMQLAPISANGLFASFSTSDRSWGQLARQASQYSDQK